MLRALSLMYEVASNFVAITNYHMEAWDMHFWHFSAFSYSLATIWLAVNSHPVWCQQVGSKSCPHKHVGACLLCLISKKHDQ